MEMQAHRRIVIFGEAKSGTTALYYKILNSLPEAVPTRTVFEQTAFVPMPGDGRKNVLAKILLGRRENFDYPSFRDFEKRILIVRDPRDRFISSLLFSVRSSADLSSNDALVKEAYRLFRAKEANSAQVATISIFEQIEKIKAPNISRAMLQQRLAKRLSATEEAESEIQPFYRFKYEDLVDERFSDLEAYLDLRLSGTADVAAKHSYVVRSKRYGEWTKWFNAEDVAFFGPVFDPYLKRHQYAVDWDLASPAKLEPSSTSEYFMRVVNEKRASQALPPVTVD